MNDAIVLAYAGGSDAVLRRLAAGPGVEVVTLTLDLGQGRDLEEARDRALGAGAVRAHVLDAREELVRDHVLPALQAGAAHHGGAPLAAALAAPLIARKLVEVAAIERAAVVAHGGGDGKDGVRIDRAVRALDPALRVMALPPGTRPTGASANLWGPPLHGAAAARPASVPTPSVLVDLAFEAGVPVAINGVPMSPTELVENLAIIAGPHAAAAVVLHAAHQALEALVSPDVQPAKRELAVRYAELVDQGLWFTPLRAAIDAFAASIQPRVTGTVRVELSGGGHTVVDAASPHARGGRTTGSADALTAVAAAGSHP